MYDTALKDQLIKEKQELQRISEEIKTILANEIKQMEEWTFTDYKEVIFDSTCCNWAI